MLTVYERASMFMKIESSVSSHLRLNDFKSRLYLSNRDNFISAFSLFLNGKEGFLSSFVEM